MKEFMLLIRKEADGKSGLSPEQHQKFLNACMTHIEKLKINGNLIAAQPLAHEGKIISGSLGSFSENPYHDTKEISVGYYHILAKDMYEAEEIAKANPE